MTAEEIMDMLINFEDHLTLTDWSIYIFRKIMWAVLQGMSQVLDAMTAAQKKVLQLLNFYESEGVQEFIKPFEPLILGITTLAAIYVLYCAMNDKETNLSKIVKNLTTGVLIFVGLPLFMSTASQISTLVAGQISAAQQSSLTVYQTNISDLYQIDKNNWEKKGNNNDIKLKKDLTYLKIDEVVDLGSSWNIFDNSPMSQKGVDILSKEIIQVFGEKQLIKLNDFFIGKKSYFRYSWHPWYMFVEFVCKIVVAYFLIYKLVRIIQEIGLLNAITHFSALSDLKTGKRNAKLMQKITTSFVIIVLIFLIQAFYDLLWVYVKSFGFSNILNLGILIPLTFGVIDGPNFVEEIFGTGAELSSASRGLFTMVQSSMMAKNVASGAMRSASKVTSTVGKVFGGSKGKGGGGTPPKDPLKGFGDKPDSNDPSKSQGKGNNPSGSGKRGNGQTDLNKNKLPDQNSKNNRSGKNPKNSAGNNRTAPKGGSSKRNGTNSSSGAAPKRTPTPRSSGNKKSSPTNSQPRSRRTYAMKGNTIKPTGRRNGK